jgi:hypothetical protein
MTTLESQLDEFMDRTKWRRNFRGSLSRDFGESPAVVVSIFTKWGNYRWSINGSEPIYSPRGYQTEDDAMFALAKELLY